MDIAFLTPSLSRALGGVYEAQRDLARSLHENTQIRVTIYGLRDEYFEADTPSFGDVQVLGYSRRGPRAFGYSPELRRAFLRSRADVAHLHSIWTYPSLAISEWGKATGRPYLISIHGMLDPWALTQSRWKKRIAALAYQRRALANARCIHVLNEAELDAVRAYGLSGPICVIPNGVMLPDEQESPTNKIGLEERGRSLLYLGRLHPKKNLANVLTAFSMTAGTHADWRLDIVGWPLDSYHDELKAQADRLGIADKVNFRGPLYGAEKGAMFSSADAFILASHSEGMPMAVLEAWAHRKPVLMTRMCNLGEGFDQGAALEVGADAPSIAAAMARIFGSSDQERRAIGLNGRELVAREFSWGSIARRFEAVYRWAAGEGPAPADVQIR